MLQKSGRRLRIGIESVKKNKPTNRQAYFQKNATKHKKPNVIEKASPDRIVTCQLHKSVS